MIASMPASAAATRERTPEVWRLSPRAIAVRLFFTCWLVYCLHLATNSVRELYPALAMGDHLSFRVDEYAGLHPDLFEKPGYGWHINSNPGASMLAALPYALARPAIDLVVARVNRQRQGQAQPPAYNSPWPMAREFFRRAWLRGLDIKLGLGAIVAQTLCMAPIAAAGVVGMFFFLRRLLASDRTALWLALLYAFGTPVFFRAGYLNHNMILGHLVFLGFFALWSGARHAGFWAGLAGGMAVLLDYTGVVPLALLFLYAARQRRLYALGALGPIALLWFYQWNSFGNPFLPAQSWMPPVQYNDTGYHGLAFLQPDLLWANLWDYRFGLFTSSPLLLLAFFAPSGNRRLRRWCVAMAAGLWLFASCVGYARLQFNTGVRYLAPAIPFLFVPAALALMRLPRMAAYFVAVLSVAQAWCLAMYRDVERGLGIFDPVIRAFTGGFTTPLLTVLSRLGGQYGDYFASGVSPLPLFALAAALLYGLWRREAKEA
jgi:hypothetical protein